jgi:N6-adenosine-specific RNA methylase IME4
MIEFHPIANIFPLLTGSEYQELIEDIRQNGLLESIWLYEGKILDGRNRYRACVDIGIDPTFNQWAGECGDPISFVIAMNLHRRHLDSSQRAACSVEALPFYEAEARKRQGQQALINQPQSQNKEIIPDSEKGQSRDRVAQVFGTNGRYVQDAKKLAEEEPELFDRVKAGELTIPKAKQVVARQRTPEPTETPPLPDGMYRCIVIDPPWPIKKIEREERPNQGIELDYPTMTIDEIAALPISDLADEAGCHLYLWVTQKYLPAGLEMVKGWGFKYQCLMTWRKNVGITPYSWMYDTEHVIFARRGNLPLNTLGLRLSFDAPVQGHSVKPNIFYEERVIQVSPRPRLDMFARREREGFEVWGNEV